MPTWLWLWFWANSGPYAHVISAFPKRSISPNPILNYSFPSTLKANTIVHQAGHSFSQCLDLHPTDTKPQKYKIVVFAYTFPLHSITVCVCVYMRPLETVCIQHYTINCWTVFKCSSIWLFHSSIIYSFFNGHRISPLLLYLLALTTSLQLSSYSRIWLPSVIGSCYSYYHSLT